MALFFTACKKDDGIPSLKETFSKDDKNPFGTYVAYDQLSQLFYYNSLKIKKTPFETSLKGNYDTSSVYISITKNLFLTSDDVEALLAFAEKGNDVFLSAAYFDTSLLDVFGLTLQNSFPGDIADVSDLKQTSVNMASAYNPDPSRFGYFYLPVKNAFLAEKDSSTKVLAENEQGNPNLIAVFYGKGRFYFHCEPRVLGNYFLLQKNNYKYLQYLFSFMPANPEHVFWDDYYNRRNFPPSASGSKSGLSVLLQYPAMAWAFWLTVSLLLLYIVFGSKRRQRIIKPVAPNVNTSVAFTETVSRLYLQKKDNRNIADKMITYFLEHIRNQYFLNTSHLNEDFVSTLSRKSNVPLEKTEALVTLIGKIQNDSTLDDQQLLLLNQQIENFYKYNR